MLNNIGTCTCRETIQTCIPCPHIVKVLNFINSTIDQIFIPKFFGNLYFTEKWSKCFEETICVIPTLIEIENFKISKPDQFFQKCVASLSKTSNIITEKRILSKGEKKKIGSSAVTFKSLYKK